MAQAPTNRQVEEILAKATALDEKKIASQAKQGKEFINNGAGVIPESVWQNLPGKNPEDPEEAQ